MPLMDRRKPKTLGERISAGVFRYLLGMLMTEKPAGQWTISLGRVATCAAMVQAMWVWHVGGDLAPGQKEILFALLAYTLGCNVINGVKDVAGAAATVAPVATVTSEKKIEVVGL